MTELPPVEHNDPVTLEAIGDPGFGQVTFPNTTPDVTPIDLVEPMLIGALNLFKEQLGDEAEQLVVITDAGIAAFNPNLRGVNLAALTSGDFPIKVMDLRDG